jgi:hypothetical protein
VTEGSRKVKGGTRKKDKESRIIEEKAITVILRESDRH